MKKSKNTITGEKTKTTSWGTYFKNILGTALSISSALVITGLCFKVYENSNKVVFTPSKNLPHFSLSDTSTGLLSPIVRLHNAENGQFFCSGMVISKNYVLTAAHCLFDVAATNTKILVKDGQQTTSVTSSVASYNKQADYGLVMGDFSSFQYAAIETNTITILKGDQPAISCGYPYGGELLCGLFVPRDVVNFAIVGNGIIFPGMSGGPVMSVIDKKVYAVNSTAIQQFMGVAPLVSLFESLGVKVDP